MNTTFLPPPHPLPPGGVHSVDDADLLGHGAGEIPPEGSEVHQLRPLPNADAFLLRQAPSRDSELPARTLFHRHAHRQIGTGERRPSTQG